MCTPPDDCCYVNFFVGFNKSKTNVHFNYFKDETGIVPSWSRSVCDSVCTNFLACPPELDKFKLDKN